MARTARKRRRPLVVAVAAVTVLAVGGGGLLLGRGEGEPAPTQNVPARPTAGAQADSYADGCLAGPRISDAALLHSQSVAPVTEMGAVSFAADVFRWFGIAPGPEQADELASTIEQLLAPTADDPLRAALAGAVENARTGSSGQDWQVSTVDATYYVQSSAAEQVVVSVAASRVISGTEQSGAQTFTLVAGQAGWQLQSVSQDRTAADIEAIGTSYRGGC